MIEVSMGCFSRIESTPPIAQVYIFWSSFLPSLSPSLLRALHAEGRPHPPPETARAADRISPPAGPRQLGRNVPLPPLCHHTKGPRRSTTPPIIVYDVIMTSSLQKSVRVLGMILLIYPNWSPQRTAFRKMGPHPFLPSFPLV